jgi:hypothetical protein
MLRLLLPAAGTAVSTVGAIQQGKSAQNLANYNAQVAQNDAIAARQKAAFDAAAQDRQARLFAGTQRALWLVQVVNCLICKMSLI